MKNTKEQLLVASPLLSFDEVLQRAPQAHLLLGNGFSRAYDDQRFSFTSLLESAVKSNVISKESEIHKVFEKLETADFETVMRLLEDSKKIIEVYKGDPQLQKKLLEDNESLKGYLVQIITNNHPEKSTSLPVSEKNACISFLKQFKTIYTLNYDLLLYWSSMQDVGGSFTDGFGNTPDSVHEGYVVYKNSGIQKMKVHYLHGALHYFDAGAEIIKKTYVNTDIVLIDQIRESLDKNIYPIFISEGTSAQKKTKILHSAYLNHCYKSLRSLSGSIVILGASLKANDRHILDALLENKVKRIYLGVSSELGADHVRSAIDDHNNKSNISRQKELILFDYKTANVWGK